MQFTMNKYLENRDKRLKQNFDEPVQCLKYYGEFLSNILVPGLLLVQFFDILTQCRTV